MCTGISYTATDGKEYLGRTQEYNVEYDYVAVQFPSHYEIKQASKEWSTQYAVLGIGIVVNGNTLPMIADGINEFGLAASTQYFADDYVYSAVSEIKQAGKKSVYAEQMILYLLSLCKDIKDVKEILEHISIPNESQLQEGGFPQHFFIKDATGHAIVVEPSIKLGFKIYANPIGVMTNSPSFDWHVTNLRNYAGLSNQNTNSLQLKQTTINSFGKGSGIFNVPGDYTAPSRFVRAATLLNFSPDVESKDAINYGFHILSTSDIPKGVITLADSIQYTQYTVIYDQTDRDLYIKFYDNLAIQKIRFDDSRKNDSQPSFYTLSKEPSYVEVN